MAARLSGRPSPRRKDVPPPPPEEPQASTKKGERNYSGLVVVLASIAVVFALLATAGLVYMAMGNNPFKATQSQPLVRESGPMVEMGQFVVNLGNVNERRFLRASITLGFSTTDKQYTAGSDQRKETWTEHLKDNLKAKEPLFKDIIVTTLSRKSAESLGTQRGKDELKAELMTRLNEQLSQETYVEAVYLTDFIIQ